LDGGTLYESSRQRAIGVDHQCDGILQVSPSFFEGCALPVRAGEFLDECNEALRDSAENCGELKIHASIITRAQLGAGSRGIMYPTLSPRARKDGAPRVIVRATERPTQSRVGIVWGIRLLLAQRLSIGYTSMGSLSL